MFRGLHTLLIKCSYTVEMIYNFITGVTNSCWLSESPALTIQSYFKEKTSKVVKSENR